jgi:hypothetical protein
MRKMAEDFQESINHVLDRRRKFNLLLDNNEDLKVLGVTCPSCGYPAIDQRACYEICILCGWEDDGQDDKNADEVWGGPNYELSLNDSRVLFETNKKSNWVESEDEYDKLRAPVRNKIINCYERILVETDPVKRAAILNELPALYREL